MKFQDYPNLKLSLLKIIAYPAALLLSYFDFYWLHTLGFSFTVSSILSALISVIVIIILESIIPYEPKWKPTWQEIRLDLVFMFLVQLILPKVLSLFFALEISDYLKQIGWTLDSLWPTDWAILSQTILMILIADLFRYWLHRWSHTFEGLWRFHAVHHSVQKLYWLNVGRFHPIDKALQYFCDVLPFVLLGVSEEVLTLYFALYAIKGFFQHSNVDVHLGVLNYIFSGPELHRWHHSKKVSESNSNYGNNLIIWDILFGSYFLPADNRVGEIGLLNPNYPTGFWKQLCAPFIKGLEKK